MGDRGQKREKAEHPKADWAQGRVGQAQGPVVLSDHMSCKPLVIKSNQVYPLSASSHATNTMSLKFSRRFEEYHQKAKMPRFPNLQTVV